MTKSEFEELLQKELDKLPYEKHVDDGMYNDGQCAGFELGARWLFSLLNTPKQEELTEDGKVVVHFNDKEFYFNKSDWEKYKKGIIKTS